MIETVKMPHTFNVSESVSSVKAYINNMCRDKDASEVMLITFITTVVIFYVNRLILKLFDGNLSQNFWYYLRKLPFVQGAVNKKMNETTGQIEKMMQEGLENKVYLQRIPKEAWNSDKIMKEVEKNLNYGRYSWSAGYVSGTVYPDNNQQLADLMTKVYGKTAYSNPLHPDVFPGIRIMESEIVRMVSLLFNAPESVGTVTSGGTESIFLACKAYREYAKHVKGIKDPNIVIPITAHAAFDKAAHMLQIKVRHVKFVPETTKVNIKAMRKAIDGNTIMLVGSTPAFPHGCIDPIEEIAKLGKKYNIPVHVDACMGGFLVAFMKKAGFNIPPFDFTVDGVTSLSVDTHKYAFAPKGTSVILYRNKIYRHYQFSIQTNWPGGIYGTPNIGGSRSGGLIATCWASLLYYGEDGYVESTKKIITTTRFIEKRLRQMKDLFVFGTPEVSVLALGSHVFDIYRLSSSLTDRGWSLNLLQFPSGFHICITMQQTAEGVAERFLKDVEECTAEIMKDPVSKTTGTAAIYGMAQQIPDRSLVTEIVWAYLDACYSTEQVTE